MWATSIVIRVGNDRRSLLAVEGESSAEVEVLRRLLARWIDDSAPEVRDHNPLLHVHLAAADAGRRGPVTLPHLRTGNQVLARSRDGADVLHALAAVLGGIHAVADTATPSRVALRAFVRGGLAVIVDAGHRHLVADRPLAAAGIAEVLGWGLLVRDDHLELDPVLPDLDWSAAGVRPAEATPRSLRLAGLVTFDPDGSVSSAVARLAAFGPERSWLATLARLAGQGRLRVVDDRAGLRAAIVQLIGG